MLKNLKVVNGSMTPFFNGENYEYNVNIDEDVITLVLDYELDNNDEITVYGNDNLLAAESKVFIEIYNGQNVVTYTLNVYKENTKSTTAVFDTSQSILVEDTENSIIPPLIYSTCFILIIILFCIIFKKNNVKRK